MGRRASRPSALSEVEGFHRAEDARFSTYDLQCPKNQSRKSRPAKNRKRN